VRVRFTPEARIAVRERRAWWEQHRDKAAAIILAPSGNSNICGVFEDWIPMLKSRTRARSKRWNGLSEIDTR
jgi:hypothetical protein